MGVNSTPGHPLGYFTVNCTHDHIQNMCYVNVMLFLVRVDHVEYNYLVIFLANYCNIMYNIENILYLRPPGHIIHIHELRPFTIVN